MMALTVTTARLRRNKFRLMTLGRCSEWFFVLLMDGEIISASGASHVGQYSYNSPDHA